MIGGYLYSELDAELDARLLDRVCSSCARIQVWDSGYLFHDEASGEEQTPAAEPGDTEAQPVASSQPLNNAVSSSNPSSRPTRLVQRE